MQNPFRYGLIVDSPYFTDRTDELRRIVRFLDSENHLIVMSPRRYGKSSLVRKAVAQTGRPSLFLNMQQASSIEDFAAMVLRGVFKLFPLERVKHFLANFRIVPTLTSTPMGDNVEVSFNPGVATSPALLEDALGLLERVSSPARRLVVVLDEFQELIEVERGVDKRLRAILQEQSGLNYIFLGSQESMMTDIFERKRSPFYHFGSVMRLGKIPRPDFAAYVADGLRPLAGEAAEGLAGEVLDFSGCHPYYTQQLAARCWEMMSLGSPAAGVVDFAVDDITSAHDLDFERLWVTMPRTSRKILQLLAMGRQPSADKSLPASTAYSAVARLAKDGYVLRNGQYEFEDPFFRRWVLRQLEP